MVKFSKIKAMRVLMYDTVRALHAEAALLGPSVLKTALRKAVIARVETLVGEEEMALPPEDIVARYRNQYPESGDRDMYSDLEQKIIGEVTF